MDDRIRALERQALMGDPEAAERLKYERARCDREAAMRLRWSQEADANNMLQGWCMDLQQKDHRYHFTSHGSHGFYIDLLVRGRRLMLDCSPEDMRGYEPGTVVLRDLDKSPNGSVVCGVFNILRDGELEKLKNMIEILAG